MDVTWAPLDPAPLDPDGFDDGASPYAHYWLSLLPPDAGPQRGTVDLTAHLRADVEEMIQRAFAPW